MEAVKSIVKQEVGEVKVVGKHVYGNLYGCDATILSDEKRLRNIVVKATKVGRMTLLDIKTWKIGIGVSVFAVILESHITIHTWPEYQFATVDVYSCGPISDPEAAFEYIAKELRAESVVRGFANRSYEV